MALVRVNVGCGASPTAGWVNLDNSATVLIAGLPIVGGLMSRGMRLDPSQRRFLEVARSQGVKWANGSKRIPLKDSAAEVIYCSHMLEHLDRAEVARFLSEVHRVLAPGGIFRVAVPDIGKLAATYAATGDADTFVNGTLLAHAKPRGLRGIARFVVLGNREHHWMYDGRSLCALLERSGFREARAVPAGTTRIPSPGSLDLAERADESVYVEAFR